MYLKIMNDTINLPDSDDSKRYRIIECREVSFERGLPGGYGYALVDGDHVTLTGTAYILSANGKTVDSLAFRPTPHPEGVTA